jgi:hypothetical protein
MKEGGKKAARQEGRKEKIGYASSTERYHPREVKLDY